MPFEHCTYTTGFRDGWREKRRRLCQRGADLAAYSCRFAKAPRKAGHPVHPAMKLGHLTIALATATALSVQSTASAQLKPHRRGALTNLRTILRSESAPLGDWRMLSRASGIWRSRQNPGARVSRRQITMTQVHPFQSRHNSKIGTFAAASTPRGPRHLLLSVKGICP